MVLGNDVIGAVCDAMQSGKYSRYDLPIVMDMVDALCTQEHLQASAAQVQPTIGPFVALLDTESNAIVVRAAFYLAAIARRFPSMCGAMFEAKMAPRLVLRLRFELLFPPSETLFTVHSQPFPHRLRGAMPQAYLRRVAS